MDMLSAIIILLLQIYGRETLKYDTVKYNGVKKVASWPQPRTVSIQYDDLYSGERKSGGCSFIDRTKPGSYMPIKELDGKHIVIEAPRGHEVEWECHWLVPKVK
jgi:hypothetical protein